MDTLFDIISRMPNPIPWSGGDNIPRNDPSFSERMLKEHLTQEHDLASRRFEKIDQYVDWIHIYVFNQNLPGRLLDLCCGPGLYASRLAQLGYQVTGIDCSPASIEYAREQAEKADLPCEFIQADIREADYGNGYQEAMLIYGELNVFHPADIQKILNKIYQSLNHKGYLILEPHTFETIKKMGLSPASWYTSQGGLFSEEPHIVLEEHFWDEESRAATNRMIVIEARTKTVTCYAQSMQAYTDEEYRKVLEDAGFSDICFYPSLIYKKVDCWQSQP